MINECSLPKYFQADTTSTTCYVLNRILIRPIFNKVPYELLEGRKPNLSHLHVFGCKCFVLNNGKDSLGKFDSKVDEGIFLGYLSQEKPIEFIIRYYLLSKNLYMSLLTSLIQKPSGKVLCFIKQAYHQKAYSRTLSKELIIPKLSNLRRRNMTNLSKRRKRIQLKWMTFLLLGRL